MPEIRLIINRKDDAYTARWVESSGQESEPFALILPLTAADTSDLRWYLETYYQFPGAGDHVRAQGIERKMEGWGHAMFDAVFGTAEGMNVFRNLMDEGQRLLTLGATDPDILSQPWEMTRDKRGPLAFQGVTIRRQLQGSRKTVEYKLGLPLRVLLIVSRPTDAGFIDPRNSIAPLLGALDALPGQVEVDFCDPPTLPRLEEMISEARKAKQPYHIVHFDGHGTYLPLTGIGALAFEDDDARANLVAGPILGDMLSRLDIPLVILEACRSSQLSDRPVFGSVAPALLQSGVGSVVAFSHAVHVKAAQILVERFYSELCQGCTAGQALEEARAALRANPKRWLHLGPDAETVDLQDWFIPQLYQVGLDPALVKPPSPTLPPSGKTPTGEGSAAQRPSLQSQLSTFPPPPMYRFHGRAMELLELERAFRRHPAVVVTGMGGMGKTALAREAAYWWLRTERFEAAVFCSFEFRAGAERVVQLLGQALEGDQFSARSSQDQWATAVDLFHRKRMLLVWDNFESTLPAFQPPSPTLPLSQVEGTGERGWGGGYDADARVQLLKLFRDLTTTPTSHLPAGRLLVTCRPQETGLPGVKEFPLSGLARPDSLYLLSAVLDLKSIPRPERAETDPLLDKIADHPLSIELIAPHLKQLSPKQICAEFDALLERFKDETAYEGRNRSLLASLEFSRQRLSPQAQAVLPYLAWFEGGAFEFSILDFAELKPEAWLPIRDELVATALVKVEELEEFNTPYIRFHPTLAYAARGTLPSPVKDGGGAEGEGLEQRFLSVYLAVMQMANDALHGHQPAAGMRLVEREEANLRAAMRRAFARGVRQEGWQIADTLNVYLQMSGRLRERDALTAWVREQMPTGEKGPLDEAAYGAILDHAWTLSTQGKAQDAIRQVQDLIARLESEGLAGGDDPTYQIALGYRTLGRIYVHAYRPDLALAPAQKAMALFESLPGDHARGNLSAALGDLANAYRQLGQFDPALEAAERGLAIDREMGHDREIAASLGQIANILTDQQRYAEADAHYELALQAARAANDLELQGSLLQHQGILQMQQGHHDHAVELYKQAIALFQRAGNPGSEMRTCDLLATAERERGQLDAAEAWYARGRELAIQLNDRAQLAVVAQNVGILYQTRAGQTADPRAREALMQQAIASVQESLQVWKELKNQVNAAASYFQLGVLHKMLGNLDQAEQLILPAMQISEARDLPEVYKMYDSLADIARARGDAQAAAQWQAKYEAKVAELEKLRRGGDKETPASGQGEKELAQFVLALAQAAYQARAAHASLPLEAAEALAQLEEQAPPLRDIAPFLRAVAEGQAVPSIPSGLPPQLSEILRELVKAVEQAGSGPAKEGEQESGISLQDLVSLVVASCKGNRQAGQRAYKIALALQQSPEHAALGQALQRLLEGLRGADVLQGLSPEVAAVVQEIEAQLA